MLALIARSLEDKKLGRAITAITEINTITIIRSSTFLVETANR